MAQTRNYLKEKIITSIVLVAVLMLITKDMTGSSDKLEQKNHKPGQSEKLFPDITNDTLPYKKESVRIQKKTDDKDVKLSIEDGKVTELEIDGKKIDANDYDLYNEVIEELNPPSRGKGKKNMYYFSDNGDEPFFLGFKNGIHMDSLMGALDLSRLEQLKELDIDQILQIEKLNKIQGDLGNLKELKGRSLGLSQEKLEKLERQLGSLRELKGQDFGLSKERMEQLQQELGIGLELIGQGKEFKLSKEKMEALRKELGNLKFNFEGLDSLKFNFDHFNFPEMKEWNQSPDIKIYRHPGGGQAFNFDFNDNYGSYEFGRESKNFSEAIGNSLNRDGLLLPGKENKVELNGKQLKINGEKQPNNIFEKYKRIFEETSGTKLEKKSKLQFNYTGKESKRKLRVY